MVRFILTTSSSQNTISPGQDTISTNQVKM